MSLKKKILIGYGVAFTLMGLVVCWAIVNLWSLGKTTDTMLRNYYRSIQAVENMQDALGRQDSGILLMLMGDVSRGESQVRDNGSQFLKWLDRAKESIFVAGESEAIEAIEVEFLEYQRQYRLLSGSGSKGSLPLTLDSYRVAILPVYNKVKAACLNLRNMNEENMYSASAAAGTYAGRAIWSNLAVGLLAGAVALVFSMVFAEKLVLPLRRFVDAARKISSGEYAVQLSVETSDELGELAVEFNSMAAQLRQYHIMNVHRIVTEKNRADAILASIEDGLVVFDINRKVTGINPAGCRILGVQFKDGDQLSCEQLIADANVNRLIAETISSGQPPAISEEQWITTITGISGPRHYLVSATPVGGRDVPLAGVVVLLRDITQLREVERLKSEFVMAASHELRTPLTSLSMSVDLLLEHATQYLPERERELLTAAHDEVNRLKHMVQDLLDLSKMEAGKGDLEFERISVATLFEHARELFRSQVSLKKIRLLIDEVDDLPLIRADAGKMVWVLSNLVSNALRYVDEGGYVRLRAKCTGPLVELAVEDNGSGIPPEHQGRIFQKFVQIDKRDRGRTGLGLALSREIVKAHGGTIGVDSTPGMGSTFTFTVPVSDGKGETES